MALTRVKFLTGEYIREVLSKGLRSMEFSLDTVESEDGSGGGTVDELWKSIKSVDWRPKNV